MNHRGSLLHASGDGPQTALTLKWVNPFALGEGRPLLNSRAHLGTIRPSAFILRYC